MNEASKLQQNMESVYNLERSNNMQFNSGKLKLIKFGKDQTLKSNRTYFGLDHKKVISDSDDVRDLGIHITPDATFKFHISKVISQVNQRIGYLLRTFNCRAPEFMRWCWKNYIQPIIDYCSQLWGR